MQKNVIDRVDTRGIKDAVLKAEEINKKIEENQARLDLTVEKKRKESEARALTKEIEKIDKAKAKRIADADWPIEGLGFSRDGVAYKDTPFVQLSSSEQLNIAVAIALSMNKGFPFAIIRDGSLLDEETLAHLKQVVANHDGQVLIERVSKGSECHVIFEDGRRIK
jgi:hypothetical protein